MSRKPLLLIATLALLMLPLSIASAQTPGSTAYCGDLDAADCEILQANAVAVVEDLRSVTFGSEFELEILTDDELTLLMGFGLDGSFDVGAEEFEAIGNDVLDTTLREMLAWLDDPDAVLETGLGYTERALIAPAGNLAFRLDLAASGQPPIPPITGEARIVNGVIYLSSPLLSLQGIPMGSWLSLDLIEGMYITADLLQDPEFWTSLGSNPDEMMMLEPEETEEPGSETGEVPPQAPPGDDAGRDMDTGELIDSVFTIIETVNFVNQIVEIINAPYWEETDQPEFSEQFIFVQRLDDDTIDGTDVAVFETTFDMAALVETEPFQQAFNDIFPLTTGDLTRAQRRAMQPVILEMIAETEMVQTQAIGLEDFLTYDFDFSWSMDTDLPGIVEALTGEFDEDVPAQTQNFSFNIRTSGFNDPIDVETPDPDRVISVIDVAMNPPSAPGDSGPDGEVSEADAAAIVTDFLPEAWEDVGDGAYVLESGETLVALMIPAPAGFVLGPLTQQIGLEETPELVEQTEINAVNWSIYSAEQDGNLYSVAIGAFGPANSQIVILITPEDAHETLREDIFLGLLDALSE